MEPAYVVVLPVKPPARGKSRLQGIPDERRRGLAEAFALDTAAACLGSPSVAAVLAVTDDAAFALRLATAGCATVPDGGAGLNGALRQAAAEAVRRWPGLQPVALLADLPALRTADLDAALAALVPGGPSYVADADGTGTTLYTAPYDEFDPAFGADSAAAHRDAGALAVRGELASLRRDVDDLDDLRSAAAIGLGVETARAADGLV
ncbi:2-phospho-L-lactate guanylyltransferase [Nocardioides sp.]|uniref:2-phospho-L-lactate guanylyltransferase n=1 Tax=Nocardioides sp. TaxID=35761 RepID=UPI002721A168|nr:2-phospho-L-lactate guanylyltransferase [Nocardioides sp.]MDO9455506.1 2-phospho-L-lactate guanylyltransferase [Nocardioides sp.]